MSVRVSGLPLPVDEKGAIVMEINGHSQHHPLTEEACPLALYTSGLRSRPITFSTSNFAMHISAEYDNCRDANGVA